jgi:hypothetical protein
MAFVWIELPLYFWRKNHRQIAATVFFSELATLSFLLTLTYYGDTKAACLLLWMPLCLVRFENCFIDT